MLLTRVDSSFSSCASSSTEPSAYDRFEADAVTFATSEDFLFGQVFEIFRQRTCSCYKPRMRILFLRCRRTGRSCRRHTSKTKLCHVRRVVRLKCIYFSSLFVGFGSIRVKSVSGSKRFCIVTGLTVTMTSSVGDTYAART
jgi:hypothetical protein